jgi:hypothetical protein
MQKKPSDKKMQHNRQYSPFKGKKKKPEEAKSHFFGQTWVV